MNIWIIIIYDISGVIIIYLIITIIVVITVGVICNIIQ